MDGESDGEKERKTRHCELTLAEKFEIHAFVKNNPDVIGTQVAKIFSEKFQKHLNNKIVYRIKRKGRNLRLTILFEGNLISRKITVLRIKKHDPQMET